MNIIKFNTGFFLIKKISQDNLVQHISIKKHQIKWFNYYIFLKIKKVVYKK
jgi:hypothetical protein